MTGEWESSWWINALTLYKLHGTRPGGFLEAVLSNDLFDAYGRADNFSKADMDLIVKFVYNQLPGDCWGSREKVKQWRGI